jgi:hypothetical protein
LAMPGTSTGTLVVEPAAAQSVVRPGATCGASRIG